MHMPCDRAGPGRATQYQREAIHRRGGAGPAAEVEHEGGRPSRRESGKLRRLDDADRWHVEAVKEKRRNAPPRRRQRGGRLGEEQWVLGWVGAEAGEAVLQQSDGDPLVLVGARGVERANLSARVNPWWMGLRPLRRCTPDIGGWRRTCRSGRAQPIASISTTVCRVPVSST